MLPELEKPRITEIHVRMDCNGCVQKIKKALHGINGIYDLYIDFPQQKLTIIGWADPEKIVKAIKKTRKIATICSHTEQPSEPPQPPIDDQPPEGTQPAPEAPNPPPPTEGPPPEAAPPVQQPSPPAEIPQPAEATPSQVAADINNANRPPQNDVGEVHVIHHHPPSYGYRYDGYAQSFGGHWDRYQNEPPPPQPLQTPQPPQPVYVTHSYNTYKPSPYVTEYEYVRPPPLHKPSPVPEYEYIRSPPQYTYYSRPERYSEDYHNGNSGNGNITSIFSDENPNACRIM